MKFHVAASLILVLLTVSGVSHAVNYHTGLPGHVFDRRAERPSGHSFLPNQPPGTYTVSYMERSLTWPTAATDRRLEFDYFVDSEPGWDMLKVYVDGVAKWSISGRGRTGHAVIPITTGGNHLVRFEYYKDSTVNVGLDTAWVDNVLGASSAGRFDRDSFSERGLDKPDNWTADGHSRGWVIASAKEDSALTRPSAHSNLGYQATATTSYTQRQIYWSAPGSFRFTYLVDSELNYDFFRVLLDNNVVFQESGRKQGTKEITVATSGLHWIRFEYVKDTSVDANLDIARVYDFSIRVGGSELEFAGFDGSALGSAGDQWQPGGYGSGWTVTRHMPPRIHLAPNEIGAAPVVDGQISPETAPSKEYPQVNELRLPDYGRSTMHDPARFSLFSSQTAEALYVALRVPSSTPTLGDEGGSVELLLDTNHKLTIGASGPCTSDWRLPNAQDRRIRLDYTIASGQSHASTTIAQHSGTCNTWLATSSADSWPATAAVSEGQDVENLVDIEMKIVLRSNAGQSAGAFESGWLGLGLIHQASNAARTSPFTDVRLPYVDGLGMSRDDVSAWQTICFLESGFAPFDSRVHAGIAPRGP